MHANFFSLLLLIFSNQILARNITYLVNEKAYEGYFLNKNPQAPLILIVHDWDGLTDYEIKRAHKLDELGYSVFAVDLFGKGIRPTEIKDRRQHTGELYENRQKMRDLLFAALETAKQNGSNAKQVVAIGYCFGGAAVLELARSGANWEGFVSFHGGLKTPAGQDYAKTKGKILILHGSADANITMDEFAQLTKELEHHKIAHEMITYGQAPHAFTVFGSENYREDADLKSWKRFTNFLQEIL